MRPLIFPRLLAVFCAVQSFSSLSAQVVINEFLASNSSGLTDQDGDYSDWIEIYNSGGTAVNLQDWSLTDSPDQPAKWRFPKTSLAPNGYLLVFASGKDRAVAGAELHASFSLDAAGEYLALVRPDSVVASEFARAYPRQEKDVSYGLYQGSAYYFTRPSPAAANSSGFVGLVADTKFSHDRGFYEAPFELKITTETPDAIIYYTTNGKPPNATNGVVYTGPMQISATTVLRAAAFRSGYLPSKPDTQTYLFLDDIIHQSSDGRAPAGWPTSWGGNTVDYGMDPDVVNNPRYSATIKQDLQTIPSVSMVLDLNDLFSSSRGIYANPGQDGINWERPGSIELIYPDGRQGFQVNAGVRIRGGYSRSTGNPKHAFRLFFREEYGDAKLRFPLFGDAGTDTFDSIDLRTFQNYSWSFEGDSRGVFIRDVFSRDAQLAMGYQGERGDYCHLYINGQYWGVYNTAERPEASYGATYFGGNKEDYDVIKVAPDTGYTIYATDGNLQAWTRLWNAAKAGLATDAAYQKLQGNNPDGTPNPDYEVLLDVDNLIDYMLVILYGGNLDAPISNFLGNTSPNNFFALRNRTARQGFQFFAHDSEHTLLDRTQNRIGPYSAGNTLDKSNPQWIWQQCWANAEFRVRVGDHVQRHFFNDGLFTPAGASNLFSKRKLQLDRAVVGESARWGDSKRSTPRTRDVEWIAEVNRILTDYMPQRTATVLGQLRTKSLYPTLAAPAFSQHGGFVPANFQLSASAPAGTVYYTTDGSDPRLMGGAISPRAARYSGPVRLTESTTVKSRAWDGASWSALNEAEFVLIQTFTELAITEIMFNPPGQTNVDGDEFEFVELKNVGAGELDLSGVHFASGIDYLFPSGTKLSPGGFVVLVSNRDAFAAKYPGVRIDGVYSGRLSNSGETLALVHAVGTPIFSVAYGDAVPWPLAADGQGFSIVPVNPNLNPDPNNPLNWRGSSRVGGSPGADDTPLNIQPVWINEILTHTDPPDVDQIELFNPGPEPAAIGNWFLTDARAEAKRYRIPPGTVIPPGGYKLFSEEEFSAPNGSSSGFRLNAHGEEVYLFSADAAGNLTGFSDGFSFGAAPNGVTFGRYINSIGEIQHPLQRSRTLGAPNSGPAVGPVVINEINYHPGGEEEEFVELKNITSSAVKLYDVERPTNSWRLAGVGFDFPPNNEIPPNGLALIVGTEPSVFRARHAVPAGVPVFGPYPGALQDSGELLELARPDVPEIDTNGVAFVPFIAVDGVRYNDKAPWPTNAAGAGASLERLNPLAYGNDPANWRASFATPSPGLENDGNRPPRVNAGVDRSFQANSFPLSTNLSGTVSDDGQPNPPGALTTVWTQTSGPAPAGLSAPGSTATGVTFPTVGTYVFRLTANDGGLQSSDDVSVTIERPPAEVTFVAAGSVWKYLDNGTDQGALWRTPEFDDQSWASGAAELGYGDASEGRPEKTVISFGPNGSDKYPTYYFRQAFNVGNSAAVKQLTLHLVRDDGAIVYLNGIEVFRDNLAGGEITFSTYANSAIGNDAESTFLESPVSPSVLREGRNVVAVEIHQSSGSSSDLSFDFALTGQAQPENQAPVVNAGADLSLAVNQTVALEGAVLDDGLPSPPGQVTVAWTKVSGPGDVTFGNPASAVTTLQVSAAGVYVLRLSGSDSVLSGQDDMTATAGGDPFADWKATYFGAAELADPTVSGDSADPDGDGHANAQEFVTGTNPKDAQSVLRAEVVEWTGAEGAPVKIQFRAMPEKSYTVQAQEFPGSQWIKVADVPPQPSAQQVEVRDANPNVLAAKLYRIVTPQQP